MTLPSFQVCESRPLSCRDHWVWAKGKGAFRIHHQMPAISVHFSASFEWALIGIVVQIWCSQHTPQKWSWIFNLFKPVGYWGKCLNNQDKPNALITKTSLSLKIITGLSMKARAISLVHWGTWWSINGRPIFVWIWERQLNTLLTLSKTSGFYLKIKIISFRFIV